MWCLWDWPALAQSNTITLWFFLSRVIYCALRSERYRCSLNRSLSSVLVKLSHLVSSFNNNEPFVDRCLSDIRHFFLLISPIFLFWEGATLRCSKESRKVSDVVTPQLTRNLVGCWLHLLKSCYRPLWRPYHLSTGSWFCRKACQVDNRCCTSTSSARVVHFRHVVLSSTKTFHLWSTGGVAAIPTDILLGETSYTADDVSSSVMQKCEASFFLWWLVMSCPWDFISQLFYWHDAMKARVTIIKLGT